MPVYDDEKTEAEKLEHTTGIGAQDGAGWKGSHAEDKASGASFYRDEGKTASPDKLGRAEKGTDQASIAADIANDIGFNDDDSYADRLSKIGKFFWGSKTRKRSVIGGLLMTLVLGGGFGFFSIASGPAAVLQLGSALENSFSKMRSDSSDRSGHLLRYAKALRTGEYGYTKVGLIGSRVMDGVLADLAEAGVTIETNPNGVPTDMGFDKATFEEQYPEVKNMTNDEFKNFMAEQINNKNISAEDFNNVVDSTGKPTGDIELSFKDYKFGDIKGVLKSTQLNIVGDNAVTGTFKARYIGKFFGLGSLFHPFSRALSQKLNERITAASKAKQSTEEAEQQFAEEQTGSLTEAEDSVGAVSADEMKTQVDKQEGIASKAIFGAGIVIAAACIARVAASEIPKINFYRVVAPSMIEATSILAQASAIRYGSSNSSDSSQSGIDMSQVGATVENFYDNDGGSVFQSAGVKTLEDGNAPKNSNGSYQNNIPIQYQQAFGNSMNIKEIGAVANAILNGITLGAPVGGFLCTSVFQYTAAALSAIAAGVASFFSGGLAAVAVSATDTAESAAVQTLVIGNVIKMAQEWFVNSNTAGKLAKDAFSGPLGGNLLAYGSRAAANLAAIGSGGISLGNTASTLVGDAGGSGQQQFESQSLYAKLFNTKDYNSLVNRVAVNIRPSIYDDFSSLVGSAFHPGNILSSVFGTFLPRASAGTSSLSGSYDWGFPQFGLPQDMLDDPTLSNPYANANTVGQYLTSYCSQTDSSGNVEVGPEYGACANSNGNPGLTARIKACFGNDLTYDSSTTPGSWDVSIIANYPVDPNDDPYTSSSCSDVSPGNIWRNIVMWINDTATMKAIACYEGTDESDNPCSDFGFSSASSNASTTNSAAASNQIDMSNLYLPSTNIPCAPGTRDIGDYNGYHNKDLVPIKLCAIPNLPSTGAESNNQYGVTGGEGQAVVNSRVSGAVYSMVKAADSDGVKLTATSSFRSMSHQQSLWDANLHDPDKAAMPGTSNHQMGLAIDFTMDECDATINGQCSDPGNPFWVWLSKIAATYGYRSGVPAEAWHWSPTGN